MRQHKVKNPKRPRTDTDISDFFSVTQRRFEVKSEDIAKYRYEAYRMTQFIEYLYFRTEITRCWSKMDLPIRYFDRDEYKRMVMALLGLTRCPHLMDKINMSTYYLKIELDNQAELAKNLILTHGSKLASQNRIEIMVDHYSPKNSKFAIDIFGILLNVKTGNDCFGIFLDTKRVWDKTNSFSKDHLLKILKVKGFFNI